MQQVILPAIFVLACCGLASSSRILFLVAFPGQSHWLMFEPLINGLLERGHEVTAITHYPLKTDTNKKNNYQEVLISPPWVWADKVNMSSYFTRSVMKESVIFKINSLWNFGIVTTNFTLESPPVKKFIADDNSRFDLVISEQFQQEAMNMFAHKYNCPIAAIGTLDYADYMHHAKGQITPWSHVPHFLSYSTEEMTLLERLENFFVSLFDAVGRKFYYLPKMTEMARVAFNKLENERAAGQLPSVEKLEQKIALHLINSHPALSYPRPKMPAMVDIAGIHIKKQKPLPSDIQKFIDDAGDGVILISFGTFLQPSEMPAHMYEHILDAFSRLKQRVIWKWEDNESGRKFPSNVMARSWLPQADILAHKNVKLLICHGGIFGTQEAIFYGKPMIVFPFYGDQHLNAFKIERDGIGILQSINELTSESLLSAINRILSNRSFYENVEKKSEIFKANQNAPLDSAIWWIEHVLKFNGAEHLQSHAKKLSWMRILSIDVVLLLLGSIYIVYDLVRSLIGRLIGDEKDKKSQKSDTKKSKSKGKKKD